MSTSTSLIGAEPKNLISKVTDFVEEFMSHYDGSHDFLHIKRVVGLSHKIYNEMALRTPPESTNSDDSINSSTEDLANTTPPLDTLVITLSALLHE